MQHLVFPLSMLLLATWPTVGVQAATAEEAQLQEFRFDSIDGGEIGFRERI